MASYVLEKAGLMPSYVVGGIVPELGTNAHCQNGRFFCAELDESDGTILKYTPDVIVINNLEPDHLDFYKNGMESILLTFNTFLSNLKETSIILANCDDKGVCELVKDKKVVTYGLNSNANYQAKNINYGEEYTKFDVYYQDEFVAKLDIILKGTHNVYNSLAVFASLHQAGVDIEKIIPHFKTFTGMGRRFEKIGEFNGIEIYDDYAHHPTEIKATLNATSAFKNKNIVAVFQPHRFTRLKGLWDEFLEAFNGADRVIITDVYSASEDPIDGINSAIFAEQLNAKCSSEHISGNMEDVAKALFPTLKSGDVVIGLGAGTITNLGKELLDLENTKVGK